MTKVATLAQLRDRLKRPLQRELAEGCHLSHFTPLHQPQLDGKLIGKKKPSSLCLMAGREVDGQPQHPHQRPLLSEHVCEVTMKRLSVVLIVLLFGLSQANQLEIFTWWAGDEGPAIEALIDM